MFHISTETKTEQTEPNSSNEFTILIVEPREHTKG